MAQAPRTGPRSGTRTVRIAVSLTLGMVAPLVRLFTGGRAAVAEGTRPILGRLTLARRPMHVATRHSRPAGDRRVVDLVSRGNNKAGRTSSVCTKVTVGARRQSRQPTN